MSKSERRDLLVRAPVGVAAFAWIFIGALWFADLGRLPDGHLSGDSQVAIILNFYASLFFAQWWMTGLLPRFVRRWING